LDPGHHRAGPAGQGPAQPLGPRRRRRPGRRSQRRGSAPARRRRVIDQKQAPATQLSLQSAPARILVADPIAEDGVARLRAAGHVDVVTGLPKEELIARIGEYDALVVRSETKVTADVFE